MWTLEDGSGRSVTCSEWTQLMLLQISEFYPHTPAMVAAKSYLRVFMFCFTCLVPDCNSCVMACHIQTTPEGPDITNVFFFLNCYGLLALKKFTSVHYSLSNTVFLSFPLLP